MHPIVQELITQRRLTGWPSRRAIHASDQAYDSASFFANQFGRWSQCGFDCVKLMASGDSQINTIKKASEVGYNPIWIVRLYGNNAPDDMIDYAVAKQYSDVKVKFIESTANEFYASYENKWGRAGQAMPPDWPKQIAYQYAKQADAILRAGCVPITPAIETWHFGIFMQLFDELIANYPDLLKQSVLGAHNRTLNHPVEYDKDPGGFRGWEDMDDYIFKRLGEHMPFIATEAGPEPFWNMDPTYPQVTVETHSDWVKKILSWPVPDYYLFDCLWEWKGRGGFERASYIESPVIEGRGDLPVVRMLEGWRPNLQPVPMTEENMLEYAMRKTSEIRFYREAALYKKAQEMGFGQAETNEWEAFGRVWQKFEFGICCCLIGDWDNVIAIRRKE
jgi:hypothetical protein